MSAQVVSMPARPGPVELAQRALSGVTALIEAADPAHAPEWSFEDRGSVIRTLDRAVELATLYRSRVLAAHKADGRWRRSGDRSFESFRGRTTRTGTGAARAEMELAEGLGALPQAVRAVEGGDVSLGHAEVLTRLRTRCSASVRAALDAGGAAELLALARGLDVPTFAKRAAAWAAARDVEEAERSFEGTRARRYGRIVDRDGGTKIDAFVDPVVGATLRTALEAVTPVPADGDTRTPEQRTADALATLAERVLGAGSEKIGAQVRPHISLVVPAEAWVAIRDRRAAAVADAVPGDPPDNRGGATGGGRDTDSDPARGSVAGTGGSNGRGMGSACGERAHDDDRRLQAAGAGGASVRSGSGNRSDRAEMAHGDDLRPHPTEAWGGFVMPELDDGTVIPLSELERIACDCELTRVVLGADGAPLDVGRTQRTYAKELRRAILLRDGHCAWPGCSLRASWCEVHHITWFVHGGNTSAANALTLCAFHHHEVHRRGIEIVGTATGHRFTRRDGSAIGTSTRDAGVLRMVGEGRAPEDRGGSEDR